MNSSNASTMAASIGFCGLVLTLALPAPRLALAQEGSAIATADAQTPGIRAEVRELKRSSSGILTLKFAIVNDMDQKYGADKCDFRETGNEECGPISGVYLVDTANKKKYPVVRDAEGKCVCAEIQGIPPKSGLNLWAKFPAPPEDVKAVTVVIPNFMAMDDVPISQ